MSLKKRIIINAGSNWASMIVTIVVGLVLVPIIIARVGMDGYGVWALLARGLGYVTILDRALVLATSRFVAYYHDDPRSINRFVSSSFVILLGMALITIAGSVLFSLVITYLFNAIPKDMAGEARITCILVGCTLSCKMLEANFSGTLWGLQSYVRYNVVVILSNIIRVVLTIVFLLSWKSIVAIQSAFLISALISMVLMGVVTFRYVSGLRIGLKYVDRNTFGELIRYMGHSIVRSGSAIVMFNTMTLLVGWKGTATDVAIYDIGSRIPGFLRGMLASTQNVFLPVISGLSAKNQIESIKAVVKKATHLLAVLTFMSVMLLFVFSEDILSFWLREPAPVDAVLVMRIFLLSVIPGGIFEIWLPTLVGVGYLRALSISSLIMVFGAVIIAFALIHYEIGAIAIAPAIALNIGMWSRGVWMPIYGSMKFKFVSLTYFRDSLATSLIATMISVMGILFLDNICPDELNWFIKLALAGILTGLIFTVLCLRDEVKVVLATVKNKIFNKGK